MKKLAVVLAIIILCTVGCSQSANYLVDPKFDTEEYLPEYDMQKQYVRPGVTMCESENAIYGGINSSYLMYLDKQSGINGILCGKAECMHNTRECNGLLGRTAGLTIYEGKLYWIGSDLQELGVTTQYLWRMELDGTKREKMQEVAVPIQSGSDIMKQIYRGYIYISGVSSAEVIDGKSREGVLITAEKIGAEGEELITIFDKAYDDQFIHYHYQMIGNKMYIMVSTHTFEEVPTYSLELYIWDSKTQKLTTLMEDYDAQFLAWYINVNQEDSIYLSSYRLQESEQEGLYKYNFKTKKITNCFDVEKNQHIETIGDKEVITVKSSENERTIIIKDYAGNVLWEKDVDFPGKDPASVYYVNAPIKAEEWIYVSISEQGDKGFKQYLAAIPMNDEQEAFVFWEKSDFKGE